MPSPSPEQNDYRGALDVFDEATQFDVLSFVVRQIIGQAVTAEVVIVKAVDPVKLTVTVQPMVHQIDGGGKATPHGQLFNVPYFRVQGGLNAAIIDPEVGDIGACLFCGRDISGVKATKGVAPPGSFRRFSWSDGLYLGGWLNPAPVRFVQISDSGITITTPNTQAVTINTGTATVNANTHATVTAPHVDLISDDVNLGATGGKKVALDGDPVVGGVVKASSTKVKGV
jgi:hypothetical protein